MHYLLTRLTDHARTDALLAQARQHWRQLVAEHDPQAQPGPPRVSHEDGLPSSWAATFYMFPIRNRCCWRSPGSTGGSSPQKRSPDLSAGSLRGPDSCSIMRFFSRY